MTFPSNPTNGQKANVNGVTYTYSTALAAWTVTSNFLDSFSGNQLIANTVTSAGAVSGSIIDAGTISATGNITGPNVNVSGRVTATGNITTSNFFIGNGSQLTGISTTPTRIFNGTSEVNIGTPNGNANVSIGGVSNVAVFSTAGVNIGSNAVISGTTTSGLFVSPRNISVTTTIGNINAMSAGPITINDQVTVTISSGGIWNVV